MKIIDKMNASIKEGRPFFSFEFFPPRTEEVRKQYNCASSPLQRFMAPSSAPTAADSAAKHVFRVFWHMLR